MALNFLFCAGWTAKPIVPRCTKVLLAPQKAALRHIWASCKAALSSWALPVAMPTLRHDLQTMRIDYGGEAVSKCRQLVAELVTPCWPKSGEACILAVEDFCPWS